MDNTITFKKILIIGCIIAILLGIFLHFAYNLSGQNIFVGLLAPVNESVWEHLKLIFVPFTTFSIFFYFYTKQKFSNLFLATVFGNIVGMFVTVILFYVSKYIFTNTNMVYDIVSYILGISAAFYVVYLSVYSKEFLLETKDSTVVGICALSLLFSLFLIGTYSPLRIDLAKDPITGTYGMIRKIV